MIIDSSALVALVLQETNAERIAKALTGPGQKGVGAPTLAETAIVLNRRLQRDSIGLLMELREQFEIVEVPFGPDHWREAARAHHYFGPGRHPAKLNFGDCMTYAVAKLAGEPLLHVGNDFTKTDLASA